MTQPLYKYVNAVDRNGLLLRDRKTGKLVSRRVQLTEDEVAAHEAERAQIIANRKDEDQ